MPQEGEHQGQADRGELPLDGSRNGNDAAVRPLWTRAFSLAIAVNFFISLVFYLLMTSMALYAVERFGASDTAAGLTTGSFVLGALAARIFAGKFLDFVGRRRMLLTGLLLYTVAALFYIPAGTLGVLITIRVLHGAAFGLASTAISASVMGLIPAGRRGEGTGYFGISATLATAVGPFLAVLLVDRTSYDVLYMVTAACAAASLLTALALRLPERTLTAAETAAKWRMRPADFFEPRAAAVASVMLVAGAAYSGVLTFLNSYAQEKDMVAAASAFFLIYAGIVFISRFVVGRLQDIHGDNAVVYPILTSFAIGLGLLAWAPNTSVLALAGAFVGMGFGALMPTAQAIAVTVAPDHRIGIATSTFFLMLDAGIGLGPFLLGLLIPLTGFSGMYAVLTAVVAAAMVLYHFVHGRLAGRNAVA
ncbi:MFS transporter [Arthrobacter koreensis]|uniref:MFS transporter n=1 Tax=Arthrobacter koreensis TaxID=199136 RepID=UPI002DBC2EDD|nr:MFS transporter [Arthrobacter koreensis]MEB7504879.1 MFS transporter [Arthrobacter koreensis]